jgi:hypothetical protein
VYAEQSYNEFTSSVNITATSGATANTVVTASAFTADGTSAYLVELFAGAQQASNVAGRSLNHDLYLDGSAWDFIGQIVAVAAGASPNVPCYYARRFVFASGSHTLSWRAHVSAGTGVISAGAGGGGAFSPGFIRITKVT